jgi:hypothetical protein
LRLGAPNGSIGQYQCVSMAEFPTNSRHPWRTEQA